RSRPAPTATSGSPRRSPTGSGASPPERRRRTGSGATRASGRLGLSLQEPDELLRRALDRVAARRLLRRAPREYDGAVALPAALGDASLAQESVGLRDGAGGVVGGDEAQDLERQVEIAGRLGAVGERAHDLSVLLVGVERAG